MLVPAHLHALGKAEQNNPTTHHYAAGTSEHSKLKPLVIHGTIVPVLGSVCASRHRFYQHTVSRVKKLRSITGTLDTLQLGGDAWISLI
jgi:hypothetical protein